ncbi:MAG: P-II family nitrogen regulator [Candidatus Riflebacteria bacterium]|nr:P-II family nitrogen regulator [Candidatus Riflebacteria bacterium]
MKLVVATFRPVLLDTVVFALHAIEGFPGGTVAEVQRIGPAPTASPDEGEGDPPAGYPPAVRLEIPCPDDLVGRVVDTIAGKAKIGQPDDAPILVLPVTSAT